MDSVVGAALASWLFEPWLTLALAVTAGLYVRGWRRLRRRSPGRFPGWRLGAFLAGLLTLLVALTSPLEAFGALLLQVHMLQHLLLMMVVPPLLWLGAPFVPLLHGLPRSALAFGLAPFLSWRALRRISALLVHPLVAWICFVVVTWVWHAPALYEGALVRPFMHELEHAMFLVTGLMFWHPVIQPWPSRPIWPRAAMIGYLILADLQNTAFSAIFCFAERVIYPSYATAPRLWGVSVMDDQATAGALMWVLGSVLFLVPVGWLVGQMLASPRPVQVRPLPRPPRPRPAPRRVDLAGILARRPVRPVAQALMLLLAVAVIVDGLLGPSMSPMNLAGVLPWTHWRGLLVIALLVAGNLFCFACPFMLPRSLARRLLPAGRDWPQWLRSKWLAVGLLVTYFWAYEAFDLWDDPAATAWIVLGYFVTAAVVDGVFRGASFCKYVCPIGQFNFMSSLISPWQVSVKEPQVCGACETTDCIQGNAHQRGCELELFQPNKVGNLDCTFCMDCIHACPHDNVGVLAIVPGVDLVRDPRRSSIGRFSRRPDLAVLALVIVFGAFANAAGMVAPFATEVGSSLGQVSWMAALALVVAPLLLAGLCAWLGGAARREAFCRFSLGLIPLGFAMWLAHFGFHFVTGATTVLPVLQRLIGIRPDWSLAGMSPVPDGLTGLELLALDIGLLLTLWVSWRVARSLVASGEGPHQAPSVLRVFLPWAVLATGLWGAGMWILLQPMQMRGMMMH